MGQTLGGTYRIVRQLDEGGMGTVFLAEHIRLRRPVAVKMMARHLKSDESALARFRREAEIISRLHHPHIVQILDFDTTSEGQPYLVMEMLTGQSLDRLLESGQKLDVRAALSIAIQVAGALGAAHSAGIVHRDLKPANIFLLDAGDELFVKLLDFGISKRADDVTPGRKLTLEFDILGTPDYMAPEQATGRTALVDHRGDQYALGVILFEMLTGRVPFQATEVMALLQRVINEPAPKPSSFNPEVPKDIDQVLALALAKNPEERFANIAAFAAALEACRAELGRPSSLPELRSDAPPGLVSSAGAAEPLPLITARISSSPPQPIQQRTSWRAASPTEAVRELVERARTELGLDNLEVALSCAESAIEVAQDAPDFPEASSIIRKNARLFQTIFERRIGDLKRTLEVQPAGRRSGSLTPEQAYLLSRLDGRLTVEEAIDLSPLSRELTLAHIVALVRTGHLSLAG